MIGRTISHYKVIEKIGQGGMGEVYLAEDTKLNRKVALKFLPLQYVSDRDLKARFKREAQAAGALNHPNIITIHEVGEHEGRPYVAMEYVEGGSLKDLMRADRLSVAQVTDLAAQISEALARAHQSGIVHRDIKPQNILIDADARPRICDFGLAKLRREVMLTQTGTTLGTIAYMSPEQARGEQVDHRADIWSLGVVIYEMLTAQRPFKGDHDQAVIYAILNNQPESITGIRPDVPGALVQIVGKAMAKSPDERYQDVVEMVEELRTLKTELDSQVTKTVKAEGKMAPSIAVLPFANLSADKEQEYFCDGMAEEIINALTHVESLRVVARTSAFAFKDRHEDIRGIGKKLNVETLLEGSVRKAGNRLRISAQLINVADGYHLWSEKYDRDMADIFAIQDEISLTIVDKLRVHLLGEEKSKIVKRHTEDPEAYNLYLKGLYFLNKWTEEGTHRGLGYFQKSIEKDPKFSLAYLGIADTYANIGILSLLPPQEAFPKAKEVLEKALEIDDSLYQAHTVAALIAFWYDWKWKDAENEFEKALAHNPGYAHAHFWYAWYLAAMGRFDEAITENKIAQELDPLLPLYYAGATGIYAYSSRFAEALEQFHKTIELDPNSGLAYFHMGNAYRIQKRYKEAVTTYQKAIEFTTGLGWAEMSLGCIYCLQGEREKAIQILDGWLLRKENQYVSSFSISALYNHLGDKDKTFEWLEKASEERDNLMALINIVKFFDNLHDDPRFEALLRKMGFEN